MLKITRRTLLKLLPAPLIFSQLGCSPPSPTSTPVSLQEAVKEDGFPHFLDVLFPTKSLGFPEAYRMELLKRVKGLKGEQAELIAYCYHVFKELYKSYHYSFKFFEQSYGEEIIAQILVDTDSMKHATKANAALDIIYEEVSKIKGLQEKLWNREYSKAHKMCVYWNTYDEPV